MPVSDGRPRFEFEGFRFGGNDGNVFVTAFDPGSGDVRIQDVEAPGRAALLVGRDIPSPPAWTFELATNVTDADGALDLVSEMGRLWRLPAWQRPGVVGELRYTVGSRSRLVVGRPRRFTWPDGGVFTQQGRAEFMCDFQLTDPRSFDDAETEVSLTLIPESTGGLIAPLVAPLTTTVSGGTRSGFVTNTGDAPAPVTVRFSGPVTNPSVSGPGWEIGLTGNLAYDVSITVDTLAGTVTRQDGAAVGGRLTRGTRLRTAALPPGESEIIFTGGDASGTARADVSFRAASWSL